MTATTHHPPTVAALLDEVCRDLMRAHDSVGRVLAEEQRSGGLDADEMRHVAYVHDMIVAVWEVAEGLVERIP